LVNVGFILPTDTTSREAGLGLFLVLGNEMEDDLAAAMATIAFTAVLLVTLLFNLNNLQVLWSKDTPSAVQMALQSTLPLPAPDPRRLESR
jgi:hypothetical protein